MPILLAPDDKTGVYYQAAPICGEDFCDSCGDCLHCYGEDWCPTGGEAGHSWYVYADQREQWLADHADARAVH